MKKKILLFLFFNLFLLVTMFSQDTLSEIKLKIERNTEILSRLLENDSLSRLQNEDIVGHVKLIKRTVVNNNSDTLNIQNVELLIKDGLIRSIRIVTENGNVFEHNGYLHLKFYNRKSQSIKIVNTINSGDSFELKGILRVVQILDKRNYLPDDTLIVLKHKNEIAALTVNIDLNSFLEFRVYTDFFGLTNRQQNGIIQSEFSSKFIYNTHAFSGSFYFFHYIEPSLKYSRLDSTDKFIHLNDNAPFDISRLTVKQKSFLELGLKLNILEVSVEQHTFELLSAGINFNLADVYNTNTEESSTISSFSYYIETVAEFLKYKNFGSRFSFKGEYQKLTDSQFIGFDSFQSFLILDFSVFYHPHGRPNNKVFLRFRNVTDDLARLLREEHNYYELQIGYKSKFSLKK